MIVLKSKIPKTKWQLQDLIDYEIFLSEDKKVAQYSRNKRDEDIRHLIIESHNGRHVDRPSENNADHRRWWLKQWLDYQRDNPPHSKHSLGTVLFKHLSRAGNLISGIGLFLGVVIVTGLLLRPAVVNVMWIIFIYIAPQFIMLVLAVMAFIGKKCASDGGIVHILTTVSTDIFKWMWLKCYHLLGDRTELSADKGERYREGLRLIFERLEDVGAAPFLWPVLRQIQRFGMFLALGTVLGILIVALPVAIPFGWSSSEKRISGDFGASVVKTIATPWRWALPAGVGYPTAAEIHQTQIMDAKNLPSGFPRQTPWYRFLILCIIFYVLIPRWIMMLYAGRMARRSLELHEFNERESRSLFRRIAIAGIVNPRPLKGANDTKDIAIGEVILPECEVETYTADAVATAKRAATADAKDSLNNKEGRESEKSRVCKPQNFLSSDQAIILTELELDQSEQNKCEILITQHLGISTHKILPFYSPQEEQIAIEKIKQTHWENDLAQVIFIYRANDPIVLALTNKVTKVIEQIKPNGHITIVLGGSNDLFEDQPTDNELNTWKEYLNQKNMSIKTLGGKEV